MTAAQADAALVDVGLRQHMLRVYNYMASGLALTGLVAYVVSSYALSDPQIARLLYGSPLKWVIMLAPVAVVFLFAARIQQMSYGTAQAVFWAYAGLMGLSLSSIFLVFTGESIARVFFITAGTFAATSLYGYTTRRDLSGFGSFLFMGLIGIVIASLVNMFIGSSALQFAISVIGVLVFTGLTAYDTQAIKEEYSEVYDDGSIGKLAIMGALRLYLDFINLFVMMLQLFASQRE
jgi:FtsH-binding integral membrane protein